MLIQILISGILLGGLYAVIGLGFSLISGVMKILNFSHGALIMLGAYAAYWIFTLFHIDPFLSIPLVMILLFAFGFIVQKFVINYIVRAPIYMTLILTFGLDMVIVNGALLAWTGNIRSVVTTYSGSNITLGDANIPIARLMVFVVAVVITCLLYVFMTKTKMGRAINATRMDIDAAKLAGVDISLVYAFTFGLGAAMAGAAGALVTLLSPISPNLGLLFSAKAFAICILGGFGNMAGPLVGGLLMGLLETAGVFVLGAGYQDAIPFALLVLVLIVRPLGILGKEYY